MMGVKSININIRVDPEVKAKADPILKQMGLTATQLYNLLLSQVAITRRVPFPIVAEPGLPQDWFPDFAEDRAAAHAAVANGAKTYKNAAELREALDAEEGDV